MCSDEKGSRRFDEKDKAVTATQIIISGGVGLVIFNWGLWMGFRYGRASGYDEAALKYRESSVDLIEAVKRMKP